MSSTNEENFRTSMNPFNKTQSQASLTNYASNATGAPSSQNPMTSSYSQNYSSTPPQNPATSNSLTGSFYHQNSSNALLTTSTNAPYSSGQCMCVPDLLQRLCKIRRHEICIDDDDFAVVVPTDGRVWARLFTEYILTGARCSTRHCQYRSDDMLWYVVRGIFTTAMGGGGGQASPLATGSSPASRKSSSAQPSPLIVYRRQSQKQPPPGCHTVNWEETTYLNLILHHIEFILTCAVCTKTSPQNLQILRKISQRVYASPSRRSMDRKGEGEEISYPYLYFSVDSFELVFSDIVLRDGESVCVELLARSPTNLLESVVFLGSVRYEVLRQVYDARVSQSWTRRWMPTGRLGSSKIREFVRMRGPHGRGYAEMAVSEVPQGSTTDLNTGATNSAAGTPNKDRDAQFGLGTGGTTTDDDDPPAGALPGNEALNMVEEAEEQYRSRRLSDTNLMSHSYHSEADVRYATMRHRGGSQSYGDGHGPTHGGGGLSATLGIGNPLKKSRSEADTAQQNAMVEATAIDEELEEGMFSRLWSTKGFGQAWHWLREKRRATSVPLNASLTFVTVPWSSVIEGLFDKPHRPVLSFNVETSDLERPGSGIR